MSVCGQVIIPTMRILTPSNMVTSCKSIRVMPKMTPVKDKWMYHRGLQCNCKESSGDVIESQGKISRKQALSTVSSFSSEELPVWATNGIFYFFLAVISGIYCKIIPGAPRDVPMGENFGLSVGSVIEVVIFSIALISMNENFVLPRLRELVNLEDVERARATSISSIDSITDSKIDSIENKALNAIPIITVQFVIAITEEVFFRGSLQPVISSCILSVDSPQSIATLTGVIMSSLIFSIFHLQGGNLYLLVNLFLGLYLGSMFEISHNVLLPIGVHAVFNLRTIQGLSSETVGKERKSSE